MKKKRKEKGTINRARHCLRNVFVLFNENTTIITRRSFILNRGLFFCSLFVLKMSCNEKGKSMDEKNEYFYLCCVLVLRWLQSTRVQEESRKKTYSFSSKHKKYQKRDNHKNKKAC